MFAQINFTFERFVAFGAFVGVVSVVQLHVSISVRDALEALAAGGTMKRTIIGFFSRNFVVSGVLKDVFLLLGKLILNYFFNFEGFEGL